ncbi:MAG: flavin monoamine oxidase family protein [Hyphomicrobiales bacterium]
MKRTQVAIIGAGAAGLMAGRGLARAGKEVTILEARDRLGGRIYPLEAREFGYPAQGGAEFVHGAAPVTHSLAREAGLTLVPREGEAWNARGGELRRNAGPLPQMELLQAKLNELEEDMPIARFLDAHFNEDTYAMLRSAVVRMVEGYDAADPLLASTLALRDEWMSGLRGEQMKIKEGYGALIAFLASECETYGAEIRMNTEVVTVDIGNGSGKVICRRGNMLEAEKVLVTIPLPLLSRVVFLPELRKKMEAARTIGFGGVIKLLLRFKSRWWLGARGQDLGKMFMLFSDEAIPTWWTQYPEPYPVLTGWLSGPKVESYINATSEEMLDVGLSSLSNMLSVSKNELRRMLVTSKIIDWSADPYARGAYSYVTPATPAARAQLLKPVNGVLFCAGEALYAGKEFATVEAALVSGADAAEGILTIWPTAASRQGR